MRRKRSIWAVVVAAVLAAAAAATPAAAQLAGVSSGSAPSAHLSVSLPALLIAKNGPPTPVSARSAEPPGLLVRITHDMAVRARPEAGSRVIGVLPDASKYYRVPTTAWVEAVSSDRQWGKVQVPYVSPRRNGWILLTGLSHRHTRIVVEVDLSAHRVTVERAGVRLFSFPAAIGSASSPTPPGRYFVTDRIPFWQGSALGSFAFGISGIQPRLPAGWAGGNQLAIHGTNNPASIGTSSSAGCVRVSEAALAKLKPLLALGTPVVIHP